MRNRLSCQKNSKTEKPTKRKNKINVLSCFKPLSFKMITYIIQARMKATFMVEILSVAQTYKRNLKGPQTCQENPRKATP